MNESAGFVLCIYFIAKLVMVIVSIVLMVKRLNDDLIRCNYEDNTKDTPVECYTWREDEIKIIQQYSSCGNMTGDFCYWTNRDNCGFGLQNRRCDQNNKVADNITVACAVMRALTLVGVVKVSGEPFVVAISVLVSLGSVSLNIAYLISVGSLLRAVEKIVHIICLVLDIF